jgi:hypothetical protein
MLSEAKHLLLKTKADPSVAQRRRNLRMAHQVVFPHPVQPLRGFVRSLMVPAQPQMLRAIAHFQIAIAGYSCPETAVSLNSR